MPGEGAPPPARYGGWSPRGLGSYGGGRGRGDLCRRPALWPMGAPIVLRSPRGLASYGSGRGRGGPVWEARPLADGGLWSCFGRREGSPPTGAGGAGGDLCRSQPSGRWGLWCSGRRGARLLRGRAGPGGTCVGASPLADGGLWSCSESPRGLGSYGSGRGRGGPVWEASPLADGGSDRAPVAEGLGSYGSGRGRGGPV